MVTSCRSAPGQIISESAAAQIGHQTPSEDEQGKEQQGLNAIIQEIQEKNEIFSPLAGYGESHGVPGYVQTPGGGYSVQYPDTGTASLQKKTGMRV